MQANEWSPGYFGDPLPDRIRFFREKKSFQKFSLAKKKRKGN